MTPDTKTPDSDKDAAQAHDLLCRWRRYRFKANLDDSRPVKFPPPGPWWESGFGDSYSIVIAYLPPDAKLTDYWPEATEVEYTEESKITFTDRFARPTWWKGEGEAV